MLPSTSSSRRAPARCFWSAADAARLGPMSVSDQAAVIAFLADPATHGGVRVERIDTHASIVFLVGERAYKLKRAVRFSYLDYSTLDARERCCRAELELNRRTAPELYEAVRFIALAPDGRMSLDGQGEIVDWVVVMRRFDQETLFDRMAAGGLLTVPLMLELADQIARFHDLAAIDRSAGGSAGLIESVASDARNLRVAVPDTLDRAQVEQLISTTRAAVARFGELLDIRRQSGKVRHCHGDLHLRNICLVAGRPTLFDCIEFNPLISNIDVLYDLAFLLMDLHARGLKLLANTVFNRYLDRRDECDGLPALPLFLSIRAAVRAHVAAAAARQQPDPSTSQNESRRYLGLAAEFLRRQGPRLIAIGGLSGSGKSTVAYGLAPRVDGAPGARVLRSDMIRKRLLGMDITDRLPSSAYSREMSARVYAQLVQEAGRILAAGYSVVADAVYAEPGERDAIAAVARSVGVPFTGLWLEAPAAIMASRIEGRTGDASDATVEVLQRQLAYNLGSIEWRRIDASGSPEAVITAACRASALL